MVGAGKTPLIADYQSVPADSMPVKTWQVNIAAKPGFTPKTVAAAPSNPADSVHVQPGDTIKLKLAASAGTWSKPASTKQLIASKPVKQGKNVVVSFKAGHHGVVTPVLVATGSSGYPGQAYAFSATVAKGKAPDVVHASERHVAKPIAVSAGQLFDIAIESNTASTGYQWTVNSVIRRRRGPAAGRPDDRGADDGHARRARHDRVPLQGTGGGHGQLVLLEQPPAEGGMPGAIYMTVVNVQ